MVADRVRHRLRGLASMLTVLALASTGPAWSAETVSRGTFSGAKETEMPDWFKQSFLHFEDDIEEAAAEGKRLMLYFHQRGCPYCNALIQDNLSQPDIVDTVRSKLDVVAINIWGDREVVQVGGREFTEKTLAEALRVSYTPTILFFNEQKKVALRLDGYYPPEQFRQALDYVTQGRDAELGYAEYVASLAGGDGGALHGEDFFMAPPLDLRRSAGARHLAVYFEKSRCEACDLLHEKVLADPPTREIARRLDSAQVDMGADAPLVTPAGERTTGRQWAIELGIKFAPTIVFFDPAGSEVFRIEAMFKTFHTQSVFDYVSSGSYKVEPNLQRYLSDRADRLIEQGIDVDIWGYRSDDRFKPKDSNEEN